MDKAKDKAKEFQKHTKLPCEKDENCFMFLPLKLGMQILGVLNILSVIMSGLGISNGLSPFSIMTLAASGIACAVGLYSSLLWVNWFKEDNQENTGKVVGFTKIMYMIGCLCSIVFGVLFILMAKLAIGAIIRVVITILLTIILGWYFFQITVRYH